MTSFGRGISSASSIFCIDASLLAISSACELVRNSSRLRPLLPTPCSSSVIWNIVRALIICSSSFPTTSSSMTVEAPSLCLLSSSVIAL